MIDRDELWRRVQAALDTRRDPLADEEVVEALLDRPDEVRAVQRLLARVAEVERLASETHVPRVSGAAIRRVAGWAAAAVAAAAALALWLRPEPPADLARPSAATARSLPARVGESRAIYWAVSIEHQVTAPPPAPNSGVSPDAAGLSAPAHPSASRLVRLDVSVERKGQRRGRTHVVLGQDGAFSITRSTGSPASAGAPLLAAALEE